MLSGHSQTFLSLTNQNDSACYRTATDQLVSVDGLCQRYARRNNGLDLPIGQKVEQSGHILPKPGWIAPFERLDAVQNHLFAIGDEAASNNEASHRWQTPQAAPLATGQCFINQRRSMAESHHPATSLQRTVRAPKVAATDAIKDYVYSIPGKVAYLFDKIYLPVVYRRAAKAGH